MIQRHQPFKLAEAERVLRALLAAPVSFVQDVLQKKMPGSWLDKDKKKAIVKWWSSKALRERVDFLKKGFADGTLL
jgi:hypothetical protein